MGQHRFVCDYCRIEEFHTDTKMAHCCPDCGDSMRWDLSNIGITNGDYSHVSDSLAMNPDQIAEHRQHFPDINVLPDGRPEFTSVKQQERYLDVTGFTKQTQRIRNKMGVTRVYAKDL